MVLDVIMDWDDVEVVKCIECCFENEVALFGDVIESVLDDCICEEVISSGWVVIEKGGVVGRYGENFGEILEWGDDGVLLGWFCKE